MKIGKKYKIQVSGFTPLIWNRMKKELIDEQKKLKKDELNEWEEKQWKRKAEYDSKENLIIPQEWFKCSLIEACKKSRIVPHFATSKQQTYTSYMQSIMITDVQSPGKLKDVQYYGAFVGAQGKNSSTKVWKVRPLIEKGWGTSLILHDPFGRMKKEELKTLLEYSGLMIGIGDNRINNFGRFEATKIEEMKQ